MATTLVWQDRFSVGVKGFDRRHRELLHHLDALFRAVRADASPEELESSVTLVKEHVHTHFTCEERLMRRHGYPGYARHLSEHQRFIDALAWVDDLCDGHRATAAVADGAMELAARWLTEHFQREDRAVADFLRAGGALLHSSAGGPVAVPDRTTPRAP